ncbi:hypothetical protein BC938DRAFT_472920 [Jimgerdemannia flammicorona]|uniref:Sas10 C-terminal domain-containing protein n=1 Tax=Jimgerdemannia flammicorona TaxID=994334 RepID=A0A433Q560_9FUNG|nr:hypothetical protein BC938DRAFT_472920 [Jimgerdemannia flammicorona]
MARKKRTVFRDAKQQAKPQGDGSDDDYISGGNVKAIDTWEDVEHDDEDEFHEARGKILLSYDNSNNAHDSDDDLLSEEEVFGLDGTAASDEDEDEDDQGALGDDDGDDDADRPDADDLATQSWGRTKKSYYDADQFSDLDEAREEEAEAIRLQKKRVQGMAEEDYLEDVAAWKGGVSLEKDDASDRKLIDTVNQDLEGISFVKCAISPFHRFQPFLLLCSLLFFSHMASESPIILPPSHSRNSDLQTERIAKRSAAELPPAEVLKILQNESPELIELLGEFKNSLRVVTEEVEPVLERAKQLDVTQAPELDFLNLKHRLYSGFLKRLVVILIDATSSNVHPHLKTATATHRTPPQLSHQHLLLPRPKIFQFAAPPRSSRHCGARGITNGARKGGEGGEEGGDACAGEEVCEFIGGRKGKVEGEGGKWEKAREGQSGSPWEDEGGKTKERCCGKGDEEEGSTGGRFGRRGLG